MWDAWRSGFGGVSDVEFGLELEDHPSLSRIVVQHHLFPFASSLPFPKSQQWCAYPPILSPPYPPRTNTSTPTQVFIFGTNFAEARLVSRALQTFYGIGPRLRTSLMSKFHIHQTAKIGDLQSKQIDDLAGELGTMTIENDLRRQVVENIKRLRDMGTYRGRRHAMGLPVRGQRTRSQVSNAMMGGDVGWVRRLWVWMGQSADFVGV